MGSASKDAITQKTHHRAARVFAGVLAWGGVSVAIQNIRFSPEALTVKAGSTVVWMNRDSLEHNVTSVSGPASFSSKNISEGKSFQFKFTRPGLYRYLCTIHREQMHGTIRVVP